MSSFEIGLLLVTAYLALYGLVSRICECIERCAQYDSQRGCSCNGDKKENR